MMLFRTFELSCTNINALGFTFKVKFTVEIMISNFTSLNDTTCFDGNMKRFHQNVSHHFLISPSFKGNLTP